MRVLAVVGGTARNQIRGLYCPLGEQLSANFKPFSEKPCDRRPTRKAGLAPFSIFCP